MKTFIRNDQYPPPWTPREDTSRVYYANDTDMLDGRLISHVRLPYKLTWLGMGQVHRVGVPMQIYAMYENGLRAKRQQSLQDNLAESARIYGKYSQIASRHPMAWNQGKKQPETVETIGTVTKRNRMICFPCTLPGRFMKPPRIGP